LSYSLKFLSIPVCQSKLPYSLATQYTNLQGDFMRNLGRYILVLFILIISITPQAYANEIAVLDTTLGTIKLELYKDKAPGHVKNFKDLANKGFYNETTFHRVIPGFMIQGGDPNSKDSKRGNDGTGGPGYSINAEFNDTPHKRGILSMARSQNPNSAGSQFFIVVKDSLFLDHQYTAFGKVIEGMDVADRIVAADRDRNDNPIKKITITSIKIEKK
jgi:cyclophilin family peptidyl-prolyl cis-trans isomerase